MRKFRKNYLRETILVNKGGSRQKEKIYTTTVDNLILGNLSLFLNLGQLAQPHESEQQLLHVKQRSLEENHHDKGDAERDGDVGEDVVEGEGVGDGDGIAGEGEDPVHHGHVDEVAGVGEAGQRHPPRPGQHPVHWAAQTLHQHSF